jgi:hypothetical protein
MSIAETDGVKMGYVTDLFDGPTAAQYRIHITQTESIENLIRKSCMGDVMYFGGQIIDRYLPQGPFCDAYMKNYCTSHINEEACACFKDEPDVLALSIERKVALPVVCYGVNCIMRNSYKTNDMKQIPCNRMLCKQEISGISDAGDNVITCNGKYFSHDGQVNLITNYYNKAAKSKVAAKVEATYDSKISNQRLESSVGKQPIYVWVCIAMTFLILTIFALFYLFPPSFFRVGTVGNKTK